MRDKTRYLTKAYTVSRDRAQKQIARLEARDFYGNDDFDHALARVAR